VNRTATIFFFLGKNIVGHLLNPNHFVVIRQRVFKTQVGRRLSAVGDYRLSAIDHRPLSPGVQGWMGVGTCKNQTEHAATALFRSHCTNTTLLHQEDHPTTQLRISPSSPFPQVDLVVAHTWRQSVQPSQTSGNKTKNLKALKKSGVALLKSFRSYRASTRVAATVRRDEEEGGGGGDARDDDGNGSTHADDDDDDNDEMMALFVILHDGMTTRSASHASPRDQPLTPPLLRWT
jgi:hypothetical protein